MNNKIKLLFSASEIDALLSKINNGNVLTDTELLKLQNLDTSVFATKTDLHTHTNKSVIDGITAEKIASWNSKSTFSGDYNDLANKPTIPAAYNLPVANQNTLGGIKVGAGLSITADGILSATGGGTADSVEWESVIGRPTRLSDFTNDSGFITSVPDEYVTETELNAKGYLTEHQDISGLALKSELHSHNNKAVIDTITSAMTTKWNKAIPFEDSYVDNCDNWLTNGYTKTSTSTTNHPSVCTGVDRWGVLFYISENATNGTGMQMYFPIDGTYAGRVFTRRIVNRNAGTWNLMSNFDGNYNSLTNKPTIPSLDGYATETYVDSAIANASLGGGGSVDTSGFALKSELHEHTNKAVIDTITSSMITAWNNKSNFSGNYDDLTNKPTIPTVTNDLTTTLKNNYDAAYNHSQEHHFSGDYNDLDNKPTIPAAYTHPATHPASMITGLSTVATSGSYADLADTPVIPAAYVHPDSHPATMITGLADVATTGSYNDLTNKPTIPSIDGLASTTYVDNKVAGIVNSAPETLNTLKELATALGNDANFATTVSNQIGSKVDKVDGKGLSTNDLTNALKANYNTAYTHSQSAHAPSNAQKNSDITKAEIEAKLTGDITTHTHSQYAPINNPSFTGDVTVAGKVTVGAAPTEDMDLTTKKYVDDNSQLYWMEPYDITGTNMNNARVDIATLEKNKLYAFNYKKYPGIASVSIIKKYGDDIIKITTFTKAAKYIYLSALTTTTFTMYVKYATGSLTKITGTFGSTISEYTSSSTPMVLDTQSNKKYTPTKDYDPATKLYADDKFATDYYEDLFTLTQEELDSSNNGGRGLVSDKISMLDTSGINSKYLYYAYYQDKVIRLTYNESNNYFYCSEMDKAENNKSIGLAINVAGSSFSPMNGGMSEVQAYKFKGDLIIKKRLKVDINDVATKKYVDEKFLPNSATHTMTLKLNTNELNFIQSRVTNSYDGMLELITKEDLSSIIDNSIETIIFEGLEKYPYKVVGAYRGFNNKECVLLELAICDSENDYYVVHRLKLSYSDDYGKCFLSSYYGDLTKIALPLNNTTEYTPTEDYNPATKKYVDDAVANGGGGNGLTDSLKANYDAAYAHSTSAHAPVNAQKNSDITKAEIEAKLTGNITSHTHSQYLTEHQSLTGYAKTANLAKVATSGSYNDLTNRPTIPAAYTHPATHPASMITGLSTVATSGSYADLTNKPTIPTVTNDLTNTLKSNYDKAYAHSQAAHAPSNAQKNSDITKSEIEAKLTGNITTHTHSQYLTSIPSEYITEQELISKGYATATTHEEVKTTVNQILGGAYIE